MWAEDQYRQSINDPKRKFSVETDYFLWGQPEITQQERWKKSQKLEIKGLKIPEFEMKSSAKVLSMEDPQTIGDLKDCMDFAPYMHGMYGMCTPTVNLVHSNRQSYAQ